MPTAVLLAQEMGTRLGKCAVLQCPLPAKQEKE